MPINILLVDDHPIFRKGLRMLLEEHDHLCVVGEAGDGESAVALVQKIAPDIVVMDISMPDVDGIEATRRVLSESSETRVMALSIHGEKRFVENMLRAGAMGYLLKESAPEELVIAVEAVARGEVYLSAAITDVVVSQYMRLLADDRGADSDAGQSTQSGSGGADLILSTKFQRPRLSGQLVSRARLRQQLDEGFALPLTLASAPAGYGKSTSLSHWLEHKHCPSAWLSLDDDDNDLRTFLMYLVAAIETIFPTPISETTALLHLPNLPPTRVLTGTLANELERAPERFILVLDDYHRIVEHNVHEFLDELLRYPPPQLHLVLATRIDPPLDLLHLRAYQRVNEVRAPALSFTVEETTTYLEKLVGGTVEAALAETVTTRTEGWVTGLHLLTLSVRSRTDLASALLSQAGVRLTLDYLIAEVLARQSESIRAYLLKTSILDQFCASLCEAVCGPNENSKTLDPVGDQFIGLLVEADLFTTSLDSRRQWYCYHHLFRELLRHQLENELDASEIATLHARASRWFAKNDQVEEAIKHAVAGGDVGFAAEIIECNRHSILNEDKWYVLDKWLSLLPDAVTDERPELLMARAWLDLERLNLARVDSAVEQAEALIATNQSSESTRGEIHFFRGFFHYFNGQGELSKEHLEHALALIPSSHFRERGEAELHYMLSMQMVGQEQRAIQELNDKLRTNQHDPAMLRSRTWGGLHFIHLLAGNLRDAKSTAQQLQALSSGEGLLYAEGWAIYGLACVSFLQKKTTAARGHLEWLESNRYFLHTRSVVDGLCMAALLGADQGQHDDVLTAINRLSEFIGETNEPSDRLIASSCRARVDLMQGEIAPAVDWLHSADLGIELGIMLWWVEVPKLTACRVLIAEGSAESLQDAVESLTRYQRENENLHHACQVINVLTLLTLAYQKQGNTTHALHLLNEALTLARPSAWIWPFVEAGPLMAELLKRLTRQGVAGDLATYINQILAAFVNTAPTTATQKTDLIEPLSPRELHVLRLLATELSPDEIADELVVSVATVRTHSKNIYGKLNAHSRFEAVNRGKEFGLI